MVKLNNEEIQDIKKLIKNNVKISDISKKYNVSTTAIYNIKKNINEEIKEESNESESISETISENSETSETSDSNNSKQSVKKIKVNQK